jgi:hypothetical protein
MGYLLTECIWPLSLQVGNSAVESAASAERAEIRQIVQDREKRRAYFDGFVFSQKCAGSTACRSGMGARELLSYVMTGGDDCATSRGNSRARLRRSVKHHTTQSPEIASEA